MDRSHAERFFSHLITAPPVQAMWNVRNGGVPLFVHTIDVAMLALDALEDWTQRYGRLDVVATLSGALLHDLTKVTARLTKGQPGHVSHSHMMMYDPAAAVAAGYEALELVRDTTGIVLSVPERKQVAHIIESHHGQWGGVAPRTHEAALVHYCDLYSARFHRQPPIDANDILPLLDAGLSKAAAARTLGVTSRVVAKRLEEACHAEWLDGPEDLLASWRRRGYVVAGSEDAQAHRQQIRQRTEQAQAAPTPLLQHQSFRSWIDTLP